MSGVVDGLVNAGYVERREDPEDRRKLRLYSTERARAIERIWSASKRSVSAALVRDSFSGAEVRTLKELLGRLCDAAEASVRGLKNRVWHRQAA